MKKGQRGFTLIELLIVIAILGIVAAVAIPRFAGIDQAAKAKDVCAANRRLVERQIELWDANEANSTVAAIAATSAGWTGVTNLIPNYLKSAPACPSDRTVFYSSDDKGVVSCSVSGHN